MQRTVHRRRKTFLSKFHHSPKRDFSLTYSEKFQHSHSDYKRRDSGVFLLHLEVFSYIKLTLD